MTKSRFKAPAGFFRKAGDALGLNLSFFEDDEEEGTQQFEGFAPDF